MTTDALRALVAGLRRCAAVASMAVMVVSCGGARVEVRNDAAVALQQFVVTARGAEARLARVEAAASRSTSLCPTGEAGHVEVAFDAAGTSHRASLPVYFECHWAYVVTVTVSPALDVTASARLR
jgi:hypothetical protein